MGTWARNVLAGAGVLVLAAGVIHLAMTGHVDHWFRAVSRHGLPDTAYAAVTLNHVVVGILLLPLGFTLIVLGGAAARGDLGARVALGGAAAAVASLPVVVWRTATSDMLSSWPFLTAVACLAVGALVTTAALLFLIVARGKT